MPTTRHPSQQGAVACATCQATGWMHITAGKRKGYQPCTTCYGWGHLNWGSPLAPPHHPTVA